MIYGNIYTSNKIIKVLDPLFRKELEWYVKSMQAEEDLKYNVEAQKEQNLEILYGKDIVKKNNEENDNKPNMKKTNLYVEPATFKLGNFIDLTSIYYKLYKLI